MNNVKIALVITFLSSNFATVVQFGVTLVLARLLTPTEIGIFSITVVFMNIIAVFREFGVTGYIQSEKNLTYQKLRSALGLLIGTSWALAIFIFSVSGYIASYYQQPGIKDILHIVTISFLIVPFVNYYGALLNRDLSAKSQSVVTIVGTIAYSVTCILLAHFGYSYLSLAWANVANLSVSLLCLLILRNESTPWLPSLSGWGHPARFGGGAIIGSLIGRIQNSLPDLILGKVSGPHDVGLYSRANGLVGIIQQIIGPTLNFAAIPLLSKSFHSEAGISPVIQKFLAYLTCIIWPLNIVIALFGVEIVRLLYGPTWIDAAPILVFICAQAVVQTIFAITHQVTMAIGRPYLFAFIAGGNTILRVWLIYLFSPTSPVVFAAILACADIMSFVLPIVFFRTSLNMTYREIFLPFLESVKVALACGMVACVARLTVPHSWPDILILFIVALFVGPTWLFASRRFRHPIIKELPAWIK